MPAANDCGPADEGDTAVHEKGAGTPVAGQEIVSIVVSPAAEPIAELTPSLAMEESGVPAEADGTLNDDDLVKDSVIDDGTRSLLARALQF